MADTTSNERQDVYTYLMMCGPGVKVSTSAVLNGMVKADYVVVHDAPPRVTREIITSFNMVRMAEGLGLLIPITAAPKT